MNFCQQFPRKNSGIEHELLNKNLRENMAFSTSEKKCIYNYKYINTYYKVVMDRLSEIGFSGTYHESVKKCG